MDGLKIQIWRWNYNMAITVSTKFHVDELLFFPYLGSAISKLHSRPGVHPKTYSDLHSSRERTFVREYKLYINGEFRDASEKKTFTSTNPFNQETIATFARA